MRRQLLPEGRRDVTPLFSHRDVRPILATMGQGNATCLCLCPPSPHQGPCHFPHFGICPHLDILGLGWKGRCEASWTGCREKTDLPGLRPVQGAVLSLSSGWDRKRIRVGQHALGHPSVRPKQCPVLGPLRHLQACCLGLSCTDYSTVWCPQRQVTVKAAVCTPVHTGMWEPHTASVNCTSSVYSAHTCACLSTPCSLVPPHGQQRSDPRPSPVNIRQG